MDKTKVLYLNSLFSTKSAESDTNIYIEGYASTTDQDRHGDVVPKSVWEKGIQNYLRNPIILAYHDHSSPIGRMTSHKVDEKGLWIKARISNAAKQYQLIKDGVLSAFSIGFRVLDAEYNSAAEVFLIKDLELVEISVVSVPANQNTLFDLSKAFESPEQYKLYKEQFLPQQASAKGLENKVEDTLSQKEWKMNPEEIKQMMAEAARAAAEEATKALELRQKAEKEAVAAEAARQAEIDARVKAAVEAHVQVGQSGAEKLLADLTRRLESEQASTKSALEGLEAAIKEKTEELKAIQSSKMTFADKNTASGVSYDDMEKAVLLSKITGKSLEGTRFGSALLTKAGGAQVHTPNAVPWELQVSLRMEEEVRRRLVVAPLMRTVAMQTNVMTMPVNPEAGTGTWITNAQFGVAASAGAEVAHKLKEVTLNAYKLATKEYMAYEEEEDSLIVLLPIVRDAMIRRTARSVDRAFINGVGSGADPVKGIAMYDASSAITIDSDPATANNGGIATVATMRALRKDLGAWGLDPSALVYVVNTEVYYNLLEDTNFLTVDKVGPQATLLTGQIGSIGNTPVVVSGEFPDIAEGLATASANVAAFCFAPGNFIVGNQRGLRVDTQELVEVQSRVLVASLRTGMTQLTTNLGQGVSTLRYVNAA